MCTLSLITFRFFPLTYSHVKWKIQKALIQTKFNPIYYMTKKSGQNTKKYTKMFVFFTKLLTHNACDLK